MASETADRAPARRLRGRRGGLKDMLNMPIDVLLEVRPVASPSYSFAFLDRSPAFCSLTTALPRRRFSRRCTRGTCSASRGRRASCASSSSAAVPLRSRGAPRASGRCLTCRRARPS